MNGRILLAGIIAGVVVFIWGALSHMVLGLGSTGIQQLPEEAEIVSVLRGAITKPGFYFFPGMAEGEVSKEVERRWEQALRRGPRGVLIYHPEGAAPLSPRQLVTELLANIAAALLAAWMLAKAVASLPGLGARIAFVGMLGLFASLVSDVPYWNWYGFPADFTRAAILDQVISWTLAGVVLGAMIRRPTVA
jgi:hypothetical protein